jgi:tRNA pseudouridine55 synthase
MHPSDSQSSVAPASSGAERAAALTRDGVVAVDKPAGVTSRRVVDVVARCLGTRAAGHAGTLDPLAEGVVLVCLGTATRLVDFLHELPKHYTAQFLLGRSSPSDDLETEVVVAEPLQRPDRETIAAALPAFRGDVLQRPCDYSAVHVDGKRAYRLARQGRPVPLAPKPVRIERLEITGYDWPRLGLDIVCSSGTFVRAIGRDLAEALGTRGVMESLVRVAVGPFERAAALPLAAVSPETVGAAVVSPAAAVGHLPRLVLEGDALARAARGMMLALEADAAETIAAVDASGSLVGILRRHPSGGHRLRPNYLGVG